MARKDLLTRLADAGEDAIARLGKAPGMEGMVGFANSTRDRLDELTKRVRGIDELEKRIARLETRLDEATGTKAATPAPARKRPPAKASEPKPATGEPKGSSGKTGGASPG